MQRPRRRPPALVAGGLLAGLAGFASALIPAAPGHLPLDPEANEGENLAADVQYASNYAQASANDAKVVASEQNARLLADWANHQGAIAADQQYKADGYSKPILAAVADAAQSASLAEAASKNSDGAVVVGGGYIKEAIRDAKNFGATHAQENFAELVKDFQDWRFAALHPPALEASKAAKKAAAPYEKAMMVTEKRIADYEQRSTSLSNQATTLRSTAQGMASTAVQMQAGGNLAGAAKMMVDAHQMMNQATIFHQQAEKLMMNAQVLQINIPAYQSTIQATYTAKMHRIAPNLYAPPPVPVVPGAPPPPVDVLMQKGNLLRRHSAADLAGARAPRGRSAAGGSRRANPFARPGMSAPRS